MSASRSTPATIPSSPAEEAERLITRESGATVRRLEAELQRARKAADDAEAASRAKSAFLANVSHEIRTPLNGILGMAHLVAQDELSPTQRERMRILQTSADSLLHVINDLLDFSKMDAGKFVLSPAPFHLTDELGETLKWLALRAYEKGLQLTYYQEPTVPAVVVGDPARLRQVLVNLVGNAIKFTEQGEVSVRIKCQSPECGSQNDRPAVCNLQFEITDTGIGIAPERLNRIFEPFEQADAATNARFGGTGLGLAIVRRLADLMGGTVTAESEPNRGSTFRFAVSIEKTGVTKPRAVMPARFADMRVVAVNPHALSREMVIEQLTDWGLSAIGVADANHVIEAARTAVRPFEVVVLDGDRTAGEALDSLRRLRDRGVVRHAVICISPAGWADPALSGLADAVFLAKPFKPTELLNALVGVLKLTPPAWLAGRWTDPAPVPAPAPLRVLLAEDNSVNQAVALGMLEEAGHTVRVVNTGRGVLAALAVEPFDVVLMDVQMPEMDGFEATAAIRAAEADTGRHLPVVAVTARAMAGDREECLRRGMDDFIAKPILPRELAQVLGRLRPMPAAHLAGNDVSGGKSIAPADQVIDVEGFRARCGGRDELVRQIARLFLNECPRYLERLRAAASAGDTEGLHAAAHTLKGSVGNLSAGAAHAAVRRLEVAARAGDPAAAQAALAVVEAALDQLRPSLRELLAGR
jgi:signal transduction histidine kinase/DNA-binding response OmpR family regulator